MSDEQKATNRQPIMVLPRGALSAEDIERLRANGICCVEADDPDAIRFVDPPLDVSVIDRCAGQIFRRILDRADRTDTYTARTLGDFLAQAIASQVPQEVTRAKSVKRR